jgi:hypothetical protein
VKLVFNSRGAIFFPVDQQHRDQKAPGISYEDDHAGNALAAILSPGRIEIRRHSDFSDAAIAIYFECCCPRGKSPRCTTGRQPMAVARLMPRRHEVLGVTSARGLAGRFPHANINSVAQELVKFIGRCAQWQVPYRKLIPEC